MRSAKTTSRAACLLAGLFAFCMLLPALPPNAAASQENIARYNHQQVLAGASDLPVAARMLYRDGTEAIKAGDDARGEELLWRATKLDPDYADPYFTLARIRALKFDFEAVILLGNGAASMWRNYSTQSLLMLNAAAFLPYILVIVAMIVGLALTLKYMPFAAHKIQELMTNKLKASGGQLTSYLLLCVPFLVAPGPVTAIAYMTLLCWLFMRWRERFVLVAVTLPLIATGLFGAQFNTFTPIADPNSLTSLVARANTSGYDARLVRALAAQDVPALESEKQMALGHLEQRGGNYLKAAGHFRDAIAAKPEQAMGYINLGNVYFLQEQYEKALEGYRKAESIEANDAVVQFNLAQAFIKTLLMKESSKSYQRSLSLGLLGIQDQYADETREFIQVLPRTYTNSDLWSMARLEGAASSEFIDGLLFPVGRFSHKASAWILLGTLLASIVLMFIIKSHQLTFQCSNCGRLTCSSCCNSEREMTICESCFDTIATVTSEKVIDALLRQKRQAAVVTRRRSARFVTSLLPGIRDIYYGRIFRGFFLSTVFSVSLVTLLSRGFIMKDVSALELGTPLWKIALPAAGLLLMFLMSIFGKQSVDFRTYRSQVRVKRGGTESGSNTRVA